MPFQLPAAKGPGAGALPADRLEAHFQGEHDDGDGIGCRLEDEHGQQVVHRQRPRRKPQVELAAEAGRQVFGLRPHTRGEAGLGNEQERVVQRGGQQGPGGMREARTR